MARIKYKVQNRRNGDECLVSLEGRSKTVALIGADTFLGRRLADALRSRGRTVTELGASEPLRGFRLPAETNQVLFCHDVSLEREAHQRLLQELCQALDDSCDGERQVCLAYFASANHCRTNGRPVREDAPPSPQNLRELAVAHCELALRAWNVLSRNSILPVILRYGELYGEADDAPTRAGHLNECLAAARAGRPVVFGGNLAQRRTLTHVADAAAAAALLLEKELLPDIVNLPGEVLTIGEYLDAIAECYQVELKLQARPLSSDENLHPVAADRVLSAALFKSELPAFRPQHKFPRPSRNAF